MFISYSETMKKRVFIITIFAISLGWAGCTKETERDFARVRTLDATMVNESGAVLNGLISNHDDHPVTECGFLIFGQENVSESYLGTLTAVLDDNGRFSARAGLGMIKNVRYYYKGYAISDGILSLGNVISYVSAGGMTTKVIDFQPSSAIILDTITIQLNGNVGALAGLEVSFNNYPAKVVDFLNDYIRVIVPSGLDTRESTINVKYGTVTSSSTQKFVHLTPVINSLSKYQAYPGDTITISGTNFHPLPVHNVVKFDDIQVVVLNSSKTEIRVRVPDSANHNNTVTVTVAGQTATAPMSLSIPTPVISSLSKSEAYPGVIITIYGSNFHTISSSNTVRFNGVKASVITASETRLDVMVPEPEGVDCTVSVSVLGRIGQAPGLFKVLYKPAVWLRMNDFVGGGLYKMASFVIGDYAYIGIGTYLFHYYNLKMWKYNPAGDQYTEIAPFPGPTRIEPFSYSINGIGYVGGGYDLDNSNRTALRDFYKYSPETNTWTMINSYPGGVSNVFVGISAVVGSKAYMSFSETAFYSFEPSTGVWTQLPVPGTGLYSHSGSFVVGNNIYVVCGRKSIGGYVKELWAFNVNSSTWSRKADYPGQARMGGNAFTIGEYGFYGLGIAGATSPLFKDIWMYDYSGDSWTLKVSDFAGNARTSSFSVVIDGKAYIGCGYESSGYLARDVYRFNPEFLK